MQQKTFFGLTLALTLSTILCVVLLILGVQRVGYIVTPTDALRYISNPNLLFSATYVNAAVLTLLNVVVTIGFHSLLHSKFKFWAPISLAFVSIYGLLNLFVYLSQVTIVPRLLDLYQVSEYRAAIEPLLLLFVQDWKGSMVSVLNCLAYALYGIPSVILGLLMVKYPRWMKATGVFYILSGITSVLGFIGVMLKNPLLEAGVVVSAFFFLVGLVLLCVAVHFGGDWEKSIYSK